MADVLYLDANASTPCDPRVVEAMLPFFSQRFANPTSRSHRPGRDAVTALETARARVAELLGAAAPSEVTFTSGATESNNLALAGALAHGAGGHVVTQATEHASVLEPLAALRRRGLDLTVLGVDAAGRLDPDAVEAALRPETRLVSVMLANNETGTLQPVAEIARRLRGRGILLHCDAAQGPGKVPVQVGALGVDLLSLSAHKAGGPKGVGALYHRRGVALAPLLHGGGQEGGLRSGTVNLPGAVGLARALELAVAERLPSAGALSEVRDGLEGAILGGLDGVTRNGHPTERLPNTANLSFAGIEGGALLASLPDLALSTGSACTTGLPAASHVLRAMGVPEPLARASLRFSLLAEATVEQAERAALRVIEEVRRLRGLRRRR